MRASCGVLARRNSGIGAWLTIVVVLLAGPAHARDSFWYLGAGAGLLKSQASISKLSQPAIRCKRQTPVVSPLGCIKSTDDSSTSVSVFGGYAYNKNVAVEVGYVNLPGTYDVSLTDPNFPAPARIDVQQDSKVLFLRSVFTLPLRDVTPLAAFENLSVSAVLGLNHWRTTTALGIDLTGAVGGFASSAKQKSSGNTITFGARVNYDFTEAVRLSVAWDRYPNLGNSNLAVPQPIPNPNIAPFRSSTVNTVKEDVDVYSVNVIYRF